MLSRSNILLVTKENATTDMVNSALNESRMSLAGVCHEVTELRASLANTPARAVVVDIDPDPSRVLHDLGTVLTTTHPETRVVVVSSKLNQDLILEAMQAGARHFLRKESITSELDEVLERLIGTGNGEREEVLSNSVISVFSASGGCGATTVAINLANELRLASSESVLTIDLDCYYGTVSAYLGITGKHGIADVLAQKERIDKDLIKSSAYNHMGDFHVLVSPASVEPPQISKTLQYENLIAVLEACREGYKYTVIDAPRVAESVAADLATVSEFVLIVFQLTVKDIKFAQSIVSSLRNYGIETEKIIPLVNRFKKRGTIVRLEDCKKALGLDSFHRIRSDWRNAMNCINRGQPLAGVAPKSGLRRDFRKLAAQISAHGTNGSTRGLK